MYVFCLYDSNAFYLKLSLNNLFQMFSKHTHIDNVPAVHAGAYLSPLSAGICLISMSH